MMRWRALARLAPLLLAAAALARPVAWARAAEEPAIPASTGYVNDQAGVMSATDRARLEAFLDQVEKKTGAQFAVLIVKSTAPLTPDEYKVRVFEQWKIGKRGEDNGLLLLVALAQREARFETGYGLEGTLPDGLQSRIFRREMAERFRQNDYSGGIIAGMLACAARVAAEKGVTLEWDGRELRYSEGGRDQRTPWWVLLMVGLFMLLVLSRLSRSGRPGGGWWMMGPGGWGGGFIGGGLGRGFGGGGFGGGGSFGGFGGGASGGGGGGGHW